GGIIGTLEYLSPEQFKGGIADMRSDIWALGVLFYEMLSGRVPFAATTFGQLYESVDKVEYPPLFTIRPDLPREVEMVISRCLRKNPSDRYQSAKDLLQDVKRLAETPLTPLPPLQPLQPLQPLPPPPPFRSQENVVVAPRAANKALIAIGIV